MSKKNLIIIIALLAFGAALALIVFNLENTQPYYVSPDESTTKTDELIGGQRDEHGCLIPAGYSWCEVKQKCLRTWEESCSIDEELKSYLNENLSDLSPRKEVLGGKFYVTDLKLTSSSTAEVSYEDGHISLQAKFNYAVNSGQISVSDFNLLPEPEPTPAKSTTTQLNFQPMNCETEPWQKWYAEGSIQFIKAPTDEELIKTYYGNQYSINIISAVRKDSSEITCQACGTCPKNYSFSAEVPSPDTSKLEALGWKK